MNLKTFYDLLLKKHGFQGWWPVFINKKISYHPRDYSYPKNMNQTFEIIIGAILTQNTSWNNVEKALINLYKENLLNPKNFLEAEENFIKELIRPAGYFNQKYKKLFLITKKFLYWHEKNIIPEREELLSLWGVGNETADSILLYAYKKPEFVIDAYTKRVLKHYDFRIFNQDYMSLKSFFENNLDNSYELFNEFHALLVKEAKELKLKN